MAFGGTGVGVICGMLSWPDRGVIEYRVKTASTGVTLREDALLVGGASLKVFGDGVGLVLTLYLEKSAATGVIDILKTAGRIGAT